MPLVDPASHPRTAPAPVRKKQPAPTTGKPPVAPEEWSAHQVGPIEGIRVGIGGWTYVPWRGTFFPGGLVQRRELEYASRQLSCIEINGTYYGAQKPATYARWRDATPEGFVFAVKAPRRIMHSRALASTGRQVEDFLGGISELGAKLGPLVWQFDGSLALERESFAAFVELLPAEANGRVLRHVLDVRDPAFIDAEFLALARRHRMVTVFTDSPDHPSFADVTGDFVYARLMRSRAGLAKGYPSAQLDAWAARARQWARGIDPGDLPRIGPPAAPSGPREVFIQFISGAKERNPAAAMALIERLQSA